MVEGMAELVDVELEGVIVARAYTNLVEEGQMLIDLTDEILLGEGVGDTFLEFAVVGIVIEQYGIGFLSVATSTACLLEISLDTIRTVDMDDHADIGFVDTHTEGIRSDHHAGLIVLPGELSLVFGSGFESGVIEGG